MAQSPLLSQIAVLVLLWAVVLLVFPSSPAPFSSVSASNVCICECCEGSGRCSRNNTRSFTIYDDCTSGCTKTYCEQNFPACITESTPLDVIANCVNRDTWVNPAVIVIFLLTVTTLGMLGFAKNFSPRLKMYIRKGA